MIRQLMDHNRTMRRLRGIRTRKKLPYEVGLHGKIDDDESVHCGRRCEHGSDAAKNVGVIHMIRRTLIESSLDGGGMLENAKKTLAYQLLKLALVGGRMSLVEITGLAEHGVI